MHSGANNVCINTGKRMCDLCGKMINFGFMKKHKEPFTYIVRRFFVSLPCQIHATYQPIFASPATICEYHI